MLLDSDNTLRVSSERAGYLPLDLLENNHGTCTICAEKAARRPTTTRLDRVLLGMLGRFFRECDHNHVGLLQQDVNVRSRVTVMR